MKTYLLAAATWPIVWELWQWYEKNRERIPRYVLALVLPRLALLVHLVSRGGRSHWSARLEHASERLRALPAPLSEQQLRSA